MAKRIAIAIGIGQTPGSDGSGGLTPLPGAVKGAQDFAKWARDSGFTKVHELTDSGGNPVTRQQIFNIIDHIVQLQGDVTKLFVYFAGHGMSSGYKRDFWILSGGLSDSSEIIDVSGSIGLAKHSQIPHVVVFSDACRTVESFSMLSKTSFGTSTIFPSKEVAESPSIVDIFYGSRPGEPSQETTDSQRLEAYGVFTKVLLEGLKGESGTISANPRLGSTVIFSKNLEIFLKAQVPLEAEKISGARSQDPDSD